jgi:methylase of polypeptide subunit release factors
MALTDDAHRLIRDHFENREKCIAIDATCGNGYDTQFLAESGFRRVIGFDIQKRAIEACAHRLQKAGLQNVELVLGGHQFMETHVKTEVNCVMFNFGYLPSGDKNVTTNPEHSVDALTAATRLLCRDGLISLMCYPGHPPGALETQAIRQWFKTLSENWVLTTHLAASPKPSAPILYHLTRTKHGLA